MNRASPSPAFRHLLLALTLYGTSAMASDARWLPQTAATATHAFQILASSEDDHRHAVDAVRVLDRQSGEVVQEIINIGGSGVWGTPGELLRVVDANADGHVDIALAYADGGASQPRGQLLSVRAAHSALRAARKTVRPDPGIHKPPMAA